MRHFHNCIISARYSLYTGAVDDEQITVGKAKLEGDRAVYEQLKSMMVGFDLGFEMMPGTGKADLTPEKNPFEQQEIGSTDGS